MVTLRQEGSVVAVLLGSVTPSWQVTIYYINGALLILKWKPLYFNNDTDSHFLNRRQNFLIVKHKCVGHNQFPLRVLLKGAPNSTIVGYIGGLIWRWASFKGGFLSRINGIYLVFLYKHGPISPSFWIKSSICTHITYCLYRIQYIIKICTK